MPDIDSLAFDIAFALTHKTGGNVRKLLRSLSESELDYVAREVAEHLRLCGWRQRPPAPPATSDQYPPVRSHRES
jgi:hypothetical protein